MISKKDLETLLEKNKDFPCGPPYKNIHKLIGKLSLESNKELEAIEHLVESQASSLRMKAYLKYDKSMCDYGGANHVLDGLLVKPGGVPLLQRLCEMPQEWSLLLITYTFDPEGRFDVSSRPMCRTPNTVHLVRLLCGKKAQEQEPYCITISLTEECRMLNAELRTIIDDFHKNLRLSLLTTHEYFRLKSGYDSRIRTVVQKLENKLLGPWASLFMGHYIQQENEDKLSDFVDKLLQKFAQDSDNSILKNSASRDVVRQLAKASAYLSERDIRKGLIQYLDITDGTGKQMVKEINKLRDIVKLQTAKRQPVILLLDEEMEMFPWEMLNIILDYPVCRLPSLHILHALYTVHKSKIQNGRFQVDVSLGYFIVNPQQNLPCNEKRLRPFLTKRIPSWIGTFGVRPTAEDFQNAVQKYNVFVYSGHGCGAEFLPGDEIQKLKVQAITFLFGCSSVTSKELGGRVEPYGIWHFYQLAGCPMVVGNLWSVTDASSDAITMDTLNYWLPPNAEMVKSRENCQSSYSIENSHEPDLLCALRRSRCSVRHYMATAALVFRGLPVVAVGSVEKTS